MEGPVSSDEMGVLFTDLSSSPRLSLSFLVRMWVLLRMWVKVIKFKSLKLHLPI